VLPAMQRMTGNIVVPSSAEFYGSICHQLSLLARRKVI